MGGESRYRRETMEDQHNDGNSVILHRPNSKELKRIKEMKHTECVILTN